ncbi:MAG: hypothetical protein LBL60_01390 [Mycoplasmataceae bacterium]|nr:hypothetical protein [Mycoplasmataceae bacterium]
MKLPKFWEEIGNLIGTDLATMIHNDFQIVEICLICAAILVGAITTLALSLKVWFCDNEDTKKQFKLSRNKFLHAIGYIFVALVFIEVFWEFILPPIWSWAASANN